MSEYVETETEFKDREGLVAALTRMGLPPAVYEEARPLVGYRGDERQNQAHVIVRRAQLGGASNDLGFRRGEDGHFTEVVSHFDRSTTFTQAQRDRLRQLYAVETGRRQAQRAGFRVTERAGADGKIQLIVEK